ncbi:MAG: proprotein convertase P-domain-containing protein [Saprospiraceae bacterium]
MKLNLRFVLFIALLIISGFSSSILHAQTFSGSTGALTDNNCSGAFNTFSATVSGVGATDVIQSLTINISHTWDSDLNIFLVGPTGTIIELSTANGGAGVNYVNTIFSDSAPSYITTGSAPFTGSFKPEGRTNNDNQCDPPGTVGTYTFASQFGGANPNGNWILKIKDGAVGDIGTLNSWSVTIGPLSSLQKVGINTVNPQATLDVNGKIKIANDPAPQAAGMIRYSTLLNDFEGFNGSVWKSMTGIPSGGGSGNGLVHPTAGSTFESGANYPGITGTSNTAIGATALINTTIGKHNSAFGDSTLLNNTTGSSNTAVGFQALWGNTTGIWNSAFGVTSLLLNTTGSDNSAFGVSALGYNTTGSDNSAFGRRALFANTIGNYNSAFGYWALYSNISGDDNSAFGREALYYNTTGYSNSAFGREALYHNTTGINNLAFGRESLYFNTSGYNNSAFGILALSGNTTGFYNSAFGDDALLTNTTGSSNSAFGDGALTYNTTGTANTAVGCGAFLNGANFSNSTAVGYFASITASNQVRLGNTSVSSIGGYEPWTDLSDSRFKNNIKDNVVGIEFIKKLKPVTYQLDVAKLNVFLNIPDSLRDVNSESIKTHEIRHGFLAQDVEKAANSLGFDFNGVDKPKNEQDPYGLRYSVFVVPLVKAVQEQQVMIENLISENEILKECKTIYQSENTVLREDFRQLATQVKALKEIVLNKEDK